MSNRLWYLTMSTGLILFSAVTYFIQLIIFHKPTDTYFYMLQDIAFVPIQVLLVTMILNEFLSKREKAMMLTKMNMVIGAFYSEIGSELLKGFSCFDRDEGKLRGALLVKTDWQGMDFDRAVKFVQRHDFNIDSQLANLDELKILLLSKRDFLLRLLENPNLLEHDTFTELLWAVFHLIEELAQRESLQSLPMEDYQHLALDIRRAYALLIVEWLYYIKHLQKDYPYIFSLVVRTNPFVSNASAVIRN